MINKDNKNKNFKQQRVISADNCKTEILYKQNSSVKKAKDEYNAISKKFLSQSPKLQLETCKVQSNLSKKGKNRKVIVSDEIFPRDSVYSEENAYKNSNCEEDVYANPFQDAEEM